ncbi:SH3 domain-containing protein [Devosia sp.]|uniref:SH3 domain-containing protein n=1 Tax=Devosia sp. TaxID=1871048 RepID=UPI0032668913
MKRQTRKLLLNIAAGAAVATAAAIVMIPAAQAAPGQVTGNVNVRSGPGTNYGVIDVLSRGTNVDVGRCQGSFCQVRTSSTSGWIASSFLANGRGYGGGTTATPIQPGIAIGGGIGINIGPNGISIGTPRPPVVQAATTGEVCFYDRTRFRGASICAEQGERLRNLGNLSERISSIDNPDGLRVEVCGTGYRDCRTYTSSASSLGDFDDYIVSVRVR